MATHIKIGQMIFNWPPWSHVRHHHRHHARPVLIVGNLAVDLIPEETIHMAITLNVGQSVPLTIAFLDQHGQPMATMPTLDAPAEWANSNAAVDTLAVADDHLSATDTAVAEGTDTVTLSLSVGGVAFSATLDVTVAAAPQVLTSVEIVPGTPTP